MEEQNNNLNGPAEHTNKQPQNQIKLPINLSFTFLRGNLQYSILLDAAGEH